MVLSKIKGKVEMVNMIAKVEAQREANTKWVLENRQELTENYPNRWLAVDQESVQIVDVDLFPIFKIMDMRGPTSSVVYYLCNDYEMPVLLVAPREVWRNDTE